MNLKTKHHQINLTSKHKTQLLLMIRLKVQNKYKMGRSQVRCIVKNIRTIFMSFTVKLLEAKAHKIKAKQDIRLEVKVVTFHNRN